jgi:hypothetical protein
MRLALLLSGGRSARLEGLTRDLRKRVLASCRYSLRAQSRSVGRSSSPCISRRRTPSSERWTCTRLSDRNALYSSHLVERPSLAWQTYASCCIPAHPMSTCLIGARRSTFRVSDNCTASPTAASTLNVHRSSQLTYLGCAAKYFGP